ncbi:uncharacterized protein LOC135827908 [Sycon ciliatum]|uniref:uncharacterized protein LOC135827908 n=1 Tax=Sycon ciliatum TaxID=27933 RepID=UPI0031F612D6
MAACVAHWHHSAVPLLTLLVLLTANAQTASGHFCQTGNVTCPPNLHCVGKGNSSDCLCNAGFTQVEDKCIVWFGGAEELPGHDNCKANEYFTVPSNYTIATAWADYAYAERACSDFGLVLPPVSVAPRCLHDFVFGLLLPDSSQRHEMVWVQRADGTLLQRSSRGHTYAASRTATAKLVCYSWIHAVHTPVDSLVFVIR